ncbi:MAG: hypothetical protein HYW95_03250 [Candidatus Wildermuthbacteria bacterium]|nr:hypothetical protein [Candidatus Wildermuthbacteria bacterium]
MMGANFPLRKIMILAVGGVFIGGIGILVAFDPGLAISTILLALFAAGSPLIARLLGIRFHKLVFQLFLFTLLFHFAIAAFLYYTQFTPFGGVGDYILYHEVATQAAERMREGNFSMQGLDTSHYYPFVIGAVYALTIPAEMIGNTVSVGLAAITALLIYAVVLKMGGKEKMAFWISIFTTSFYPSYVYYGSLLLKDTLVIPLVLLGVLLMMNLMERFSVKGFIGFCLILIALFPLRIYVGFAMLFTFIISWVLFSKVHLIKKIILGAGVLYLVLFIPSFSGHTFGGFDVLQTYMSESWVSYYRQDAYVGSGSTVEAADIFGGPSQFIRGLLGSFMVVLLGPLPWQVTAWRQMLGLGEVLLWYFALPFIALAFFTPLLKKRMVFILVIFSILLFGVLSVYVSNMGIITRIRMPAFILLFSLLPFGLYLVHQKIFGSRYFPIEPTVH